jgi:hypothetical protein
VVTAPLPQRLQAFYESLPVERENALRRLEDIYTSDVHFRDPFRETRGIEALRVLFERMFRQYRQIEFTGFSCDGDGSSFSMTYDMHLAMVVGPTFVTHMATICRARDGRISHIVDSYDFPSALTSPLPLLGAVYRRVVNRFFL